MKKTISLFALTIIMFGGLITMSFTSAEKTENAPQGKSYWFSYYNNGNSKKLYLTDVYNNDCNYCSNEIKASFKKWLILNDYENTVTSVNIDSQQDIEAASLEERREKIILKYKGYGYTIVRVNYSYQGE